MSTSSLPVLLATSLLLASCATRREVVEPPSAPPVEVRPATLLAPAATRTDSLCVLRGDGLEIIPIEYSATGDTTFQGRPLRELLTAERGYAQSRRWFIASAPINHGGRLKVMYGLPRVLSPADLEVAGFHDGVPVFRERGDREALVLYLPVRPGCVFQTYYPIEQGSAVRGG
jgi:hypothetical protein